MLSVGGSWGRAEGIYEGPDGAEITGWAAPFVAMVAKPRRIKLAANFLL
jgi:hypothetical protein